MKSGQSALGRRVRQGCTGPPPPPHSTPTKGGCKTALSKFRKTRNCDKIILNFPKLEENFAKLAECVGGYGPATSNYKMLKKDLYCTYYTAFTTKNL